MEGKSEKILIVDDEQEVRELIARMVGSEGYPCATAAGADQALALLARESYALMIADIKMPGKSGLDLLAATHADFPDLAVIMVTAVNERAVALKSLQMGAYGFVAKPFADNELLFNLANALRRRELEIDNRRHRQELKELVAARTSELRASRTETIYKLARAAEFRDNETAQHTVRMGHLCGLLAQATGQPRHYCEMMAMAAPLHDVGKIGISDTILLKPGRLTREEFETIKQHPEIGYRILGDAQSELLNLGAVIALTHHEKFNGSGYPGGLIGRTIPLAGRIAAICDVFDALTSQRVYKAAISVAESLEIMQQGRGEHFDPELLDRFIENIDQFVAIKTKFSDAVPLSCDLTPPIGRQENRPEYSGLQ